MSEEAKEELLSLEEIEQRLAREQDDVPKRSAGRKRKSWLRETAEVIIVAVLCAALLKAFVVEMYWVPSESMVPTIMVKDRVVVTKFNYWFREPQRGEIVVFESPTEKNKNLIKRLIGVPGDIIEFKNNTLYLNGQAYEEPYLDEEVYTADFGPVTVPIGMYFMCGDNRLYSLDSRSWGFASEDLLIGKGVAIYWPLARAKCL